VEPKAKNSKVAHEHAEQRTRRVYTGSGLQRVKPYVQLSVYIARGLRDGTRVASSALYWPANEVSSQTPGRLRPGDLNLDYNSCHILSICLVGIHRGLVLYGKSCGRAELGRLGNLLEGLQEVVWATN
jgi:hypothetical protein